MEQRNISAGKRGSPGSTRAGVCQQKASRATLPLTALFLGTAGQVGSMWLGSGTVGSTLKRLGALAWDVRLDGSSIGGPANHQKGGADCFFMPSQEGDWIHQGACRQQRNY